MRERETDGEGGLTRHEQPDFFVIGSQLVKFIIHVKHGHPTDWHSLIHHKWSEPLNGHNNSNIKIEILHAMRMVSSLLQKIWEPYTRISAQCAARRGGGLKQHKTQNNVHQVYNIQYKRYICLSALSYYSFMFICIWICWIINILLAAKWPIRRYIIYMHI